MRSRDGLHLIQGQLREDRLVTLWVVLADTLLQESVPEVASGSCMRSSAFSMLPSTASISTESVAVMRTALQCSQCTPPMMAAKEESAMLRCQSKPTAAKPPVVAA
jgi:hypothetical protein